MLGIWFDGVLSVFWKANCAAYFLHILKLGNSFLFIISLAVSAVVNMLWGRTILGDFGAYTISALIVLTF